MKTRTSIVFVVVGILCLGLPKQSKADMIFDDGGVHNSLISCQLTLLTPACKDAVLKQIVQAVVLRSWGSVCIVCHIVAIHIDHCEGASSYRIGGFAFVPDVMANLGHLDMPDTLLLVDEIGVVVPADICENIVLNQELPKSVPLGNGNEVRAIRRFVAPPINILMRKHGSMANHEYVLPVCRFKVRFQPVVKIVCNPWDSASVLRETE